MFFQTIEQEIAGFARKLAAELGKAEGVVTEVEGASKTIETVTGLVFPAGVAIEKVAFGLLGKASTAIADGQTAAAGGLLNLTLDEQEFADLKTVVDYLKNHPAAPTSSVPVAPVVPATKAA
jgi:hypothetical protein